MASVRGSEILRPEDQNMRTSISKCLRILIAFSVALSLTAARAQAPTPDGMPGSSMQQQDTNAQNCANGDVSACKSMTPSTSTTGLPGEGGVGSSSSSSFAFPNVNPGSPNAPMSVYRDDAGGLN